MEIEEALHEIQPWLFLEGVEGVAQGEYENEPCITVFVSLPEVQTVLPSMHRGYKVVVEHTDQFMIQGGPL